MVRKAPHECKLRALGHAWARGTALPPRSGRPRGAAAHETAGAPPAVCSSRGSGAVVIAFGAGSWYLRMIMEATSGQAAHSFPVGNAREGNPQRRSRRHGSGETVPFDVGPWAAPLSRSRRARSRRSADRSRVGASRVRASRVRASRVRASRVRAASPAGRSRSRVEWRRPCGTAGAGASAAGPFHV